VLGYAQHSGALPSGFVGEAFDSGISHSLEGKKREGAPGAAFSLKPTTNRELTTCGVGLGATVGSALKIPLFSMRSGVHGGLAPGLIPPAFMVAFGGDAGLEQNPPRATKLANTNIPTVRRNPRSGF